jgi:hypothetical protein
MLENLFFFHSKSESHLIDLSYEKLSDEWKKLLKSEF